jgi:hypothetical protein
VKLNQKFVRFSPEVIVLQSLWPKCQSLGLADRLKQLV